MKNTKRKWLEAQDLALVVGCQCKLFVNGNEFGIPTPLSIDDISELDLESKEIRLLPMLRMISGMTDDEKIEFSEAMHQFSSTNILEPARGGKVPFNWFTSKRNVEMTKWLLRKHFDVFGWIKDGSAEDINAVKSDSNG